MKKRDRLIPKKKRKYRATRHFDLMMYPWQRDAYLNHMRDVPLDSSKSQGDVPLPIRAVGSVRHQ